MADENTNSQRITSLENRIERQTLPPREAERKAPMQGDDERRQRTEVSEQELRKELTKEENKGNVYVTKAEVQDALNALMAQIANLVATKTDLNNINMSIASISRNVDANFVTKQQAQQIAKDAVPMTIRDIDSSASQRTGDTLMLSPGGASGRDSVYFGTVKSSGGDTLLFDFKASKIVGNSVDDSVKIATGLKQVIGSNPVVESEHTFLVSENSTIYIELTYDYSTPYWGTMACVATASVPSETNLVRVFRIATITGADDSDGYFRISAITQNWFGILWAYNVSRCV